MPIEKIYPGYFQKSKSFLFPALGIPKGPFTTPTQSYVSLDGVYSPADKKLICRYNISDPNHEKISEPILYSNPLFEHVTEIDMDERLYIFNMDIYSSEFENFLKGAYSKFSEPVKEYIKTYFGGYTKEYEYMETFLYPERFFDLYGQLLDISTYRLEEVGELCDLPDRKKENCIYIKNSLEKSLLIA